LYSYVINGYEAFNWTALFAYTCLTIRRNTHKAKFYVPKEIKSVIIQLLKREFAARVCVNVCCNEGDMMLERNSLLLLMLQPLVTSQ
jgi:hypothetical protein